MIKRLSILLVACIAGLAALQAADTNPAGKNDNKSKEEVFAEIQNFKKKYLAQEMELTESQQQPFSELYDEMMRKKFEIMEETRKAERKVRNKENVTEEDYQEATEALNKARLKDAKITEEYDGKFATFLSKKQIFKMKDAEEVFRKKMESMRHHKRGKKNR